MKNERSKNDLSRRGFLRDAGLMGLSGTALVMAGRSAPAASPNAAVRAIPASGYDLDRFRKTDPALIHYEQVGTFPVTEGAPNRITVAPGGTLWVTAGNHIVALDQKGEKVAAWTASGEVACLAVSSDGLVYAGLLARVQVFDSNGRSQAQWKSPASKAWLASIAVGEKDVFVTDAGNRVVHRFDRSGNLLNRIGEKDQARDIPAFVVPSPYFDLEIGGDGYLWVANPGFHQLQAFSFEGSLEKKWGQPSFAIEGFCGCCNPSYFTRLASGAFVTSEKGLPRLKVYSSEGKFESVVAGAESFPKYLANPNVAPIPMDVAADATGRIFVADTLGRQIRVYQKKTQV